MIHIATIKEIAKIAKVSSSTVSRVLNKDYSFNVSEETRRNILEVATSLNYRQRSRKKQNELDVKKNWKIGLLFWCSEQFEFSDPFYMSIRQGIEKECTKQGVTIHRIYRWVDDSSPEIEFSDIDGLIVVGKVEISLEPKRLRLNFPIVFVDYKFSEEHDSVRFDVSEAARKAMEHLLKLGYTEIGYIGGTSYIRTPDGIEFYQDERQKTYEIMLKERGLFKEQSMFIGSWGAEEGYRLMKEAIEKSNLPRAFFVASDLMAIGALRALHESDIKIPDQVGLTSIDGIDVSKYVNPPLTTVRVYTEEMGCSAVKLIIDRLTGRDYAIHVNVATELMIRESCGNLNFVNGLERC
ncbi:MULTISPECIES: LacI family DNA-binding transcriptional regulator [Paenibacillus]|uniref:HTH-type transcriptional regulator MsmR n=1 Tax=Paenibacillus albilobatus TaxID=2716884 RepID=A0A920C823_9BACL|nr:MULTISPECIES: LacI family DNA-binding transcriptional regulator [Paenibacillus]GIO29621.1 putative HTH-type transcriptional regulator MsmR [Paenibacillus albilobatus]